MIIALQYWTGDEPQALALARLIADIEPTRRCDAILALCRRGDCPVSDEARRTEEHCNAKLPTMLLRSPRPETGHPDGCFGLWAGSVAKLHRLWQRGVIPADLGQCVFTCESDGGPIRADWIDRLKSAHWRSLALGKRITGAVMDHPVPHVNGNLVLDLAVWSDHPCLSRCPPGASWDCHHATTLLAEARPSLAIRNDYDATDLTPGYLRAVSRETAWVHGCKDGSVIRYARKELLG